MARKRLTLCASLLIAVALLLPPFAAAADALPSFSLEVSKSSIKKGEEFTVAVKGANLTDLYAFEVNLYYDPKKMEFKAGSETSGSVGFGVPAKVVTEDGKTHLLYAHTKTGSASGDSGSVSLATFTFVAKENGLSTVTAKDIQLIDSNLILTMPATSVSRSVRIGPTPSADPGTGASGGGTGSGATDPAVVAVTAEQLKDDGTGKASVALKEGETQLALPANTAELLGTRPLEVASGGAILQVPAALFKQLTASLTEAQAQGGSIALIARPFEPPASLGADRKPSGQAYELQLKWIGADGSSREIGAFAEPATIRLPLAAAANPKLASVYSLPDGGAPQRIGGEYAGGYVTARVSSAGSYAALFVDKTFSDVPSSHWAYEVIRELAAKEAVDGTGEGAFEPNRSVTRAEFASMLVRALGLTEQGAAAFEDVPAGSWYAKDVSIAYKAGIVQGTSADRFSPGAKITREEMVALAVRSYEALKGQKPAAATASFQDEEQISAWARDYAKKASALGLVQGRAAGQFAPRDESTRAEAAQVIYRLLNL